MAGSKPAREAALKEISATLSDAMPPASPEKATFVEDMKHASALIAGAVRKGSWKRNASWIRKYQVCVSNTITQPP
jgi:hypothetical protein